MLGYTGLLCQEDGAQYLVYYDNRMELNTFALTGQELNTYVRCQFLLVCPRCIMLQVYQFTGQQFFMPRVYQFTRLWIAIGPDNPLSCVNEMQLVYNGLIVYCSSPISQLLWRNIQLTKTIVLVQHSVLDPPMFISNGASRISQCKVYGPE